MYNKATMSHPAMSEFEPATMSDYKFAMWLKKRKAVHDHFQIANMTCWRQGDVVIACAIYDNAKPDRTIYLRKGY